MPYSYPLITLLFNPVLASKQVLIDVCKQEYFNNNIRCVMSYGINIDLFSFQSLNITGNMIEHIPVWVAKKLKGLRVFKISKNQIQSVSK